MNPLTLVKRIQNINKKEASLGISEEASWHAKYKDSAYVYVGGIPFDLTEGDLLAVFAQYGEIVDVNLVRDKGTGKSKGFAFIAYEDQRSTNLAVDNLNGAQILGRTVRVDHVNKYKKLEEEEEETKQQKREERGVCRAFQRGQCTYGDGCKFSHDEQRAANTGWGAEEDRPASRWVQDKFEGSNRDEKTDHLSRPPPHRGHRSRDRDSEISRAKEDDHKSAKNNKKSRQSYNEPNSMEERVASRNEKRSRKYEPDSYKREDEYGREQDRGSVRDRDISHHRRRRDEDE